MIPIISYRTGALYAIWDRHNRIVGVYLRHNPEYGLPEFLPLDWRGSDSEPCRSVCAGPRARVQIIRIRQSDKTR